PTGFPAGVNPETFQVERVARLLKQAAYLPIFSAADPRRPNVPIPSPTNPLALIGVEVNEELHRLDVLADPPGPERIRVGAAQHHRAGYASRAEPPAVEGGWCTRKSVGEAVATVGIRWMVMPDDFEAAPGKVPPPTELDPARSQRFCMLDGHMGFKDDDHS